jgi:hypothetical protein
VRSLENIQVRQLMQLLGRATNGKRKTLDKTAA